MWNLKYGTNEPVCETEMRLTDIKNRRVVPEAEGRWGRDELRLGGEQIEAVPYRINKRVYCIGEGNCTHYPVINLHGKEYKKVCVYSRVSCHTSEINTTLSINSTSIKKFFVKLNQKERKAGQNAFPFKAFPPSWEVEKETCMNFFWHKSFLIVFKISIT